MPHRGAVPAAGAPARRAPRDRPAQLRRTPSPSCCRPAAAAPSLRVVNYTHPEYGTLLDAVPRRTPRADAMLMRGTEGEPVADPRRAPRLDVFIGGQLRAELSRAAQEGVLTELPVLPRSERRGDDRALHPVGGQRREARARRRCTQQVECLITRTGRASHHPQPQEKTRMSPVQARVTLVGAGPGDPELLTIKAVRAIRARHRAAGRRPGRRRRAALRAALGAHRARRQARRLREHAAGLHREADGWPRREAANGWCGSRAATRSSSAAAARRPSTCARRASRSRWSTASPPAWRRPPRSACR